LEINEGQYNSIKGNNVSDNGDDGIYIENSKRDSISENLLLNNSNGIFLSDATESTIINNSIGKNRMSGVMISNLTNGSFDSNYLYNNQENGAFITRSQLIMIHGNNASDNDDDGITIVDSNNNIILENQAYNNKNVGIYLMVIENNTIKGNKALNNTIGMAFIQSRNNSILESFVDINPWRGMSFESNSNNNTIMGNAIGKSGVGMVFLGSMNNKIKNNTINNSVAGAALQQSLYNNILNNNIISNKIGLYLNRSDNNMIGENRFDHNEVGLAINVSANNALENRTFTNNRYNVLINENETIPVKQFWKRIILKRLPSDYLEIYQKGSTRYIETPDFSADSSSGSGGKTSNDGGSGPSISVSIQSICDAYFDSLGSGKLLLNSPDKMNQSESYTVEAYIPRNYTLNLSSNPSLTGVDRWFNLSKVGEYMGLKLEGGSAFSINPAEEVEQYIPNGQVGTWTWEVTPLLKGEQKLTLKVTTYYKRFLDEKGIPASASFHRDVEVTPKEIAVQVDGTPPTKGAFNDIIAIAGGIVGLLISILTLIKLYGEVSKRKKD
jgi:parallel beta-helix repeat protein